MSIEFLDDSTLWVSLSFIIFVCITLKPMLAQLSDSLEKKIDDLKNYNFKKILNNLYL